MDEDRRRDPQRDPSSGWGLIVIIAVLVLLWGAVADLLHSATP